jgi:hypothetical protein
MIEAVAMIIGLFCIGIFVTHAVEGYPRVGDWLARRQAVSSMYRLDSRKTK